MLKKTLKKKIKKTLKKRVKKKLSKKKIIKQNKKSDLQEINLEEIAQNFKPKIKIQKNFSLIENPASVSLNTNLESSLAQIPIGIKEEKEDEGRLYEIKGNYGTNKNKKEENYLEAPKTYQEVLPEERVTNLREVKKINRERSDIEMNMITRPKLIGEGGLALESKKEDYFITGQFWEEGKKTEQEKIREEYMI